MVIKKAATQIGNRTVAVFVAVTAAVILPGPCGAAARLSVTSTTSSARSPLFRMVSLRVLGAILRVVVVARILAAHLHAKISGSRRSSGRRIVGAVQARKARMNDADCGRIAILVGHVQASQEVFRLDSRLDGSIVECTTSHEVERRECILLRIEGHEPAISDVGTNSRGGGAALALENALHLLGRRIEQIALVN